MRDSIYSFLLFKALYEPKIAFAKLAEVDPAPLRILFRYSLWLLLLPPPVLFHRCVSVRLASWCRRALVYGDRHALID
jgi:hypothetical protein